MSDDWVFEPVSHYSVTHHAKVGKCTLCNEMIINDESRFWCRNAKIISTKWFCGDCLLSIKPIVDSVSDEFQWMEEVAFEISDGGLNVDPETGRLRKE